MLKHLKKKSNSKSWVGRLRDFGENCANFSFDPEKNTLFYAPIALHHNKMFQKILTTNREIKICMFLDQILLKLLVFQRNNWTCFCILNELLHAKTSQNWPFSGSRDIRLHSFWPIAHLTQKFIFNTKLTNVTFLHLLCPIMLEQFKKLLIADHEIA